MITFYNDDTEFKDKPNSQSGKITNNLNKKISKNQVTNVNEYWELLNIIEKGKTILPALFKDSIKEENFISQQLVFLDFDNTDANNYISIEDIRVDPFIETYAYLVYKTYSHTEKHNKFRVVFCLDTPCTDLNDIKNLIMGLLTRYPQADQSCKNVTRHYYATNKISNIIYRNVVTISDLQHNLRKSYKKNSEPNVENKETPSSLLDFSKIKTTKPNANNNEVFYENAYENYINPSLIIPDLPVYELIKQGMIPEAVNKAYRNMKKIENYSELYHLTFPNHIDSVNKYTTEVDLFDFFEIPKVSTTSTSCYDIFTEDTNPSASVYQHKNGVFLYKRFKEDGKSYDIQNLLIALNPKVFTSFTSVDFILACFESKVSFNGKLYKLSSSLKALLKVLEQPDQSEQYPETWLRFRRNYREAVEILRYMESRMAIDANGDIQYYIFTSQEGISRFLMGNMLKDTSPIKVKRTIALLKSLFVIITLSEEQRSKKIDSWYSEKRKLKDRENTYLEHRRKLDHLIINPEENLLLLVETHAKLLNDFNLSNTNLSARTLNNILEGWGDTVFPQHKPQTKAEELRRIDYNSFYNDCIKIINKEINKKGYIIEDTLKSQLKLIGYKNPSNLLVTSRTDFLSMYNLNRKRASKSLKTELNIPQNRRELKKAPYIYYTSE